MLYYYSVADELYKLAARKKISEEKMYLQNELLCYNNKVV